MELKTNKKQSPKEILEKIKGTLQSLGFSLIQEHDTTAGNIYEFENNDKTTKIFCRISPSDSTNVVFLEFSLPIIEKKLKEALKT
jgi:hypothetical protein